MQNLGLIIAWTAMSLQALLLFRGWRAGLVSRYPYFYAFVGGTLIVNGLVLYVYEQLPGFYRGCYWCGEFLTLVLACGIILEIFRHVLAPYPGPRRFARFTGIVAFTVVLFSSGIYPLLARPGLFSATMGGLERNVRAVQALFLFIVLALISYYGIRIGKNMRGMMLGYGIAVGASLLSMAGYSSADEGRVAELISQVTQQVGYAVPLVVWTITLWSYAPNPVDVPAARIEEDYEQLTRRTQGAVSTLRGYLGRAVRP